MASPKTHQETARKLRGKPHHWHQDGWSLGLSYAPLTPEQIRGWGIEGLDPDKPATYCMFSAMLHPRGRSSTDADWERLGRFVAELGVPVEACLTPLETTGPNSVHYWAWAHSDGKDFPSKSDLQMEAIEGMAAARKAEWEKLRTDHGPN